MSHVSVASLIALIDEALLRYSAVDDTLLARWSARVRQRMHPFTRFIADVRANAVDHYVQHTLVHSALQRDETNVVDVRTAGHTTTAHQKRLPTLTQPRVRQARDAAVDVAFARALADRKRPAGADSPADRQAPPAAQQQQQQQQSLVERARARAAQRARRGAGDEAYAMSDGDDGGLARSWTARQLARLDDVHASADDAPATLAELLRRRVVHVEHALRVAEARIAGDDDGIDAGGMRWSAVAERHRAVVAELGTPAERRMCETYLRAVAIVARGELLLREARRALVALAFARSADSVPVDAVVHAVARAVRELADPLARALALPALRIALGRSAAAAALLAALARSLGVARDAAAASALRRTRTNAERAGALFRFAARWLAARRIVRVHSLVRADALLARLSALDACPGAAALAAALAALLEHATRHWRALGEERQLGDGAPASGAALVPLVWALADSEARARACVCGRCMRRPGCDGDDASVRLARTLAAIRPRDVRAPRHGGGGAGRLFVWMMRSVAGALDALPVDELVRWGVSGDAVRLLLWQHAPAAGLAALVEYVLLGDVLAASNLRARYSWTLALECVQVRVLRRKLAAASFARVVHARIHSAAMRALQGGVHALVLVAARVVRAWPATLDALDARGYAGAAARSASQLGGPGSLAYALHVCTRGAPAAAFASARAAYDNAWRAAAGGRVADAALACGLDEQWIAACVNAAEGERVFDVAAACTHAPSGDTCTLCAWSAQARALDDALQARAPATSAAARYRAEVAAMLTRKPVPQPAESWRVVREATDQLARAASLEHADARLSRRAALERAEDAARKARKARDGAGADWRDALVLRSTVAHEARAHGWPAVLHARAPAAGAADDERDLLALALQSDGAVEPAALPDDDERRVRVRESLRRHALGLLLR